MEFIEKAKSIREMRINAGISQWPLALAVQRTQGWLSNIELGYVTPSDAEIEKIKTAIRQIKRNGQKHQNANQGSFRQ